jgi:hypothetical protein
MSTVYMTSADVRAARFEVLVEELRPLLRRSHPDVSEEVLFEHAVHIAALRLAGGNITWALVG